MLSETDAAWFRENPHREFRCRHLTEVEHAADHLPVPPGRTGTRLAYVRRSDGASVFVTTPMPDLLLSDENESRARFCAQSMPNPPPLDEPVRHVEAIPLSSERAAYLDAKMVECSISGRQ